MRVCMSSNVCMSVCMYVCVCLLIRNIAYDNFILCFSLFRWFEGFDWEGLVKRTMVPPIIPNVRPWVTSREYTASLYIVLSMNYPSLHIELRVSPYNSGGLSRPYPHSNTTS